MKGYQVLLALLCINYIYSVTLRCAYNENASKETCNAGLSDDDKNDGYMYCCYLRYKIYTEQKEEKRCKPVTEFQYKNIDYLLKYIKIFELGSDDINLECGSNFFKFSFLSLILLLL